ncbi:hypothetical protein A8B82_02770 [Sulfitobacter sp. EhC04]|uniref:lipase/acyltransferase domain-containing protein n=1 Tax=Sulfitobacter sp. EhC04 TaxID=1849168 RepID=UPI0007F4C591|nr:alpha/beta hydrolase [Sulfitobacter sp. EhC04]OAN73440.1 hypothetical protein A8B82_02770 [Sulfitobacter sp. EhC04]
MPHWALKFVLMLVLSIGALPAQAQVDRKLIVIPGIVGSELSNQSDEVIWGRVSSLKSSNFRQLDLLPENGDPVALKPTDALREVPLVFGTVNIGLYAGLIDFLVGKRSIFDSAAQRQILGNYTEGTDLFVFAYDWRRSNFANAVLLNEFVKAHVPAGEQFDIVAHSMGGLLSRAFLSDLRPQDFCTDPVMETDLPAAARAATCHAAYGTLGDGGWRGIGADNRFSEASRLHTFVEIATPHQGSVNVASTLVDGWGRLSQILIGGKRDIQNILLSMVGPYELIPSYENCCAMGEAGRPQNSVVAALDETYWSKLVLGFEVDPCPYAHCASRRALLLIGLQNRALLDQVFAQGLPDTVTANHVMVGRLVDGTRETMYVARGAEGDGVGITYRTSARGDGTVYEGSALADGNQSFVLRSKHPFIVGSDEVHRYVYNILIDPVQTVPQMVNSERIFVGGGDVESLVLRALPQIAGVGQTVDLRLDLTADSSQNFDGDDLATARIELILTSYSTDAPVWQQSVGLNEGLSFAAGGLAVFTASLPAPGEGVYLVTARIADRSIAQELLHVLEDES